MSRRTPLHQQIYMDLLQKINEGRYPHGSLLPTEQGLMEHYGVSRAPVRQALSRLEADGAIVRRPGYGTTVLHPKLASLTALSGFAQFYSANPAAISSRLLQLETLAATDQVAAHLGVKVGAEVVKLTRLRLVADEPVAYMQNYVRGKLVSAESDEIFSLSDLFQREWNVVEGWAEESLRAVAADEMVAQTLRIPPGTPILYVIRRSWDLEQRPVAYSEYYVRSDRMEYKAVLSRAQTARAARQRKAT